MKRSRSTAIRIGEAVVTLFCSLVLAVASAGFIRPIVGEELSRITGVFNFFVAMAVMIHEFAGINKGILD